MNKNIIYLLYTGQLLGILRPKNNIYVFQVSALKKLGMVGWHNILFCRNILYRNCIFQYIFSHFPRKFDNILLTINNKIFRVGAKT